MLIKPTQEAQVLLLQTVAPEAETVRRGRVHPKLGAFTATHPLRPDVAEQMVGEEAKLVGLPCADLNHHALRTKPRLLQGDTVASRLQIGIDGTAGRRAYHCGTLPILIKLQHDITERHIALIAHIANKHGVVLLRRGSNSAAPT